MTLDALIPAFRAKVETLLDVLARQGFTLRPYCTVRDPFTQAKLWRQSRSSQQIKTMIARLRAQGAPRIAACIDEVGPQHGVEVTKAVPGYSWHQHGEAVDCFLLDMDGHADWDASAPGYVAYAREAGRHARGALPSVRRPQGLTRRCNRVYLLQHRSRHRHRKGDTDAAQRGNLGTPRLPSKRSRS